MDSCKLSGKPDELRSLGWGDVTCDVLASHPGGVRAILLVASCYGNRDKLRRCGPLGSCASARLFRKSVAALDSIVHILGFMTFLPT